MSFIRGFVVSAALAVAFNAQAQVTFETAPNLNAQIVDDGYNGSLASMTCATIAVSGSPVVKSVKVLAYMNHTWVGDLTIKLVSPANTVVTLMSRPGILEAADDGIDLGGASSNILSTFPIEFVGGGSTSAESMGSTLSSSQVVCRDDGACSYSPNSGAASPGSLVSFIGQTRAGNWKFCAGDSASGDTGDIVNVRLTFASGILQISAPSTDFGSIPGGSTSAEQSVTLNNTGNASLTINTISVALPPFSRTATGTCGNSLPMVLAVSASCTLTYTFTPQSGASVSQLFAVQSDGDGDVGFELKGSSPLPENVFTDGFE